MGLYLIHDTSIPDTCSFWNDCIINYNDRVYYAIKHHCYIHHTCRLAEATSTDLMNSGDRTELKPTSPQRCTWHRQPLRNGWGRWDWGWYQLQNFEKNVGPSRTDITLVITYNVYITYKDSVDLFQGRIYKNPHILMVNTMVSWRCPLKPIQWKIWCAVCTESYLPSSNPWHMFIRVRPSTICYKAVDASWNHVGYLKRSNASIKMILKEGSSGNSGKPQKMSPTNCPYFFMTGHKLP